MKKQHIRRFLWLAAAVSWMFLIFHFSNQRAVESSEISGTITYRMAEWTDRLFHFGWKTETLEEYAELLQYPVRKAAHMTEYAVLAGILLGNCIQYPVLEKRRHVLAWLGASGYAATDEFHQLFVEGRSGEFRDVCIDSAGAVIGLVLIWGVGYMYVKMRRSAGDSSD